MDKCSRFWTEKHVRKYSINITQQKLVSDIFDAARVVFTFSTRFSWQIFVIQVFRHSIYSPTLFYRKTKEKDKLKIWLTDRLGLCGFWFPASLPSSSDTIFSDSRRLTLFLTLFKPSADSSDQSRMQAENKLIATDTSIQITRPEYQPWEQYLGDTNFLVKSCGVAAQNSKAWTPLWISPRGSISPCITELGGIGHWHDQSKW